MVEVTEVEILKDAKLNVTRRRAKKNQIFLYDTGRKLDLYLAKLKYRRNGNYDDIPHYIITKNGEIINVFDSHHSSKTFGKPEFDRKLVKVAIENLGWLQKNTITGVLHNWIGDPYRGDPFVKKWRDYYFWDPYTEGQLVSVVDLTKELCNKHSLPYQTVPSQGYLSNVRKFNGIVCKSNFLNIYTDINPSFNFNIFYKDDYKETDE